MAVIVLAVVASFTTIYYSSLKSSQHAQEMGMTVENYQIFATKMDLDPSEVKNSFEAIKKAESDPTSYPGFYWYWFESFLVWLAIFSIGGIGTLWLFSVLRKKM